MAELGLAVRRTGERTATLDQCLAGEVVQILDLGDRDDDDDCRFREVGLYEGAQVTVLTPGDPVVLALFDSRFAVCRRCARYVRVVSRGVIV